MLNVRLATAAGAMGSLAVLAACGGSGSAQPPGGAQVHSGASHGTSPAHAAGTETFTATTASMSVIAAPSNSLPVKASGSFADTGSINLSGNGKSAVLHLRNGTIAMSHGRGTSQQSLDRANCHAILVESGLKYQITGGTGRYSRISGSGTAELTLIAALPKDHGTCNASQSAVPTSARETFTATGPVRY
jgi:hypothetical protein